MSTGNVCMPGGPCNYTRDEACLITRRRVSDKNCPSAHLWPSEWQTLFRLIMRSVWTRRSQNDIVLALIAGVISPTLVADSYS